MNLKVCQGVLTLAAWATALVGAGVGEGSRITAVTGPAGLRRKGTVLLDP